MLVMTDRQAKRLIDGPVVGRTDLVAVQPGTACRRRSGGLEVFAGCVVIGRALEPL